jgi:Tol biopolymer transport system component/predicted Ser/Thr protein kinase
MSPGLSVAHYRIASKLGEGGMGAVYRATDTKLSREVAIKILPEAFASDPDRLARFEREAQVLAALNHPNIAAIYGVEHRALVMELVDGRNLAGPLPEDQLRPVVEQLIDALEYAHEKGIVHRDLKPANLKLTSDGRLKVLDFGLAKAMGGAVAAGDPATSPTLTMHATKAGTIVGTAAYMSPEQARGQAVDKRADIWSFGVVLYEFLTGRRLFEGDTTSDTLASVLKTEPDLSAVPRRYHRLLRLCLVRDPRRRLRDISGARLLLEEPEPAAVAAPQAARKTAVLPWVAAAVFALASAGLAFLHFGETPAAPASPVRFSVSPPAGHAFGNWLAVSPDGRYLAFYATGAGGTRLWLRSFDSVEARPIPGTEGAGPITVFWSADSRSVVFQQATKVRRIDIAGGAPQILCDSPATLLGGSWSPAGVVLIGDSIGPIWRTSSAGGTATPVTRIEPARGEGFHTDPVFLPDGRHFLYFRHSSKPENQGVFVGSIDAKPEEQSLKRIQPVDISQAYAAPRDGSFIGHLLFLRNETLMAQRFDQRRLETAGDPVPVAEQVGTYLTRGLFSVSPTGVLAYRSGAGSLRQLVWYDRQGKIAGHPGERADYIDVALSPDGSRAAYSRSTQRTGRQIWILDFARGIQSSFTFQGARAPVWSPDGRHLAFGSQGGEVYVQEVNGSPNASPVYAAQGAVPSDWSRDGRFLLVHQPLISYDFAAIPDPLRAGAHQPIPAIPTNSTFLETHGQLSPDGRYLAYSSNESGRAEVYVCPFLPAGGHAGKWLVSSNGGSQPRWRGDGKEIFYIDPGHAVMAVDTATQPEFRAATPRSLFTSPGLGGSQALFEYDVTRDGKRFLMIGAPEGAVSEPATVVLDWEALLKK